ncbi:NUDIX hydrolase domain-like protein [Cokeromyces recurvatus]|uniref:NUDIX hydrolase domain-like protein n=1 Tax=Cokeromyces recurvatus TaxID=90255 RepID=UPI00221FD442|nr:NUDIX hydrolase domain-like protein [Cokeromyces recurvatus]KAI7897667.1 NUDIX hydrolase domain-like protein [Cokeromyces recurvatus]
MSSRSTQNTAFKSLLDAVKYCDKFPYTIDPTSNNELHHAVPFILGSYTIGHILPHVLPALNEYNDKQSRKPFDIRPNVIQFSQWVNTSELRTMVVKELMDSWRAQKTFDILTGWRNELYPVYGDESQPDNIAFVMERAASPLFGILTFGVHLNAYTKTEEGQILMWVAKRSKTKQTWPNLLDNCVAGGISYNYSVKDTIIKECDEEASIPIEIASKARSVNTITYYTYTSGGLQPETQYIFDLEMPKDFTPTPRDGEAECFYLWPLEKVKETILNNEWKPNCALVAIDFMMRHSFITPDDEPDYIDITYGLHRRLEFPTPHNKKS